MQLGINKSGPLSIKDQIKAQVRALITSGELAGGEPLPSAKDLAAMVEINRNTAALAYRELAEEGLVETIRGSGTFVNSGRVETDYQPLQGVLDEALDRAEALGFKTGQISDAFYERLTARTLEPDRLVLVAWCNQASLDMVCRALETELGVKTKGVLLQHLKTDPQLCRACFKEADLIVTSVNYLDALSALGKPQDLEAVGLLLTSTTQILNEISRLPKGTTVGVSCVNHLASQSTNKIIHLSGGSTLQTIWAGADDSAGLKKMMDKCQTIFATSFVFDQVKGLARQDQEIIKLDIAISPVHLDLVRDRLHRTLRAD